MSNETPVKVKEENKERLTAELPILMKENKPLYDLLFDLAEFIKESFSKELIITMIFRTDDEQDAIYKDDPKYITKKFKSPHQIHQAADIRSKIFTSEEIKKIEDFLNTKYNPVNVYAWTAKNHKVGAGAEHFHIQLLEKKK